MFEFFLERGIRLKKYFFEGRKNHINSPSKSNKKIHLEQVNFAFGTFAMKLRICKLESNLEMSLGSPMCLADLCSPTDVSIAFITTILLWFQVFWGSAGRNGGLMMEFLVSFLIFVLGFRLVMREDGVVF